MKILNKNELSSKNFGFFCIKNGKKPENVKNRKKKKKKVKKKIQVKKKQKN